MKEIEAKVSAVGSCSRICSCSRSCCCCCSSNITGKKMCALNVLILLMHNSTQCNAMQSFSNGQS